MHSSALETRTWHSRRIVAGIVLTKWVCLNVEILPQEDEATPNVMMMHHESNFLQHSALFHFLVIEEVLDRLGRAHILARRCVVRDIICVVINRVGNLELSKEP